MIQKFLHNERGSALILVVLLGLIMSSMAIVALRNITYTTRSAAIYRTRTQAQMSSDSVVRLYSNWLGQNAATTLSMAQSRLEQDLRMATDDAQRNLLISRGPTLGFADDQVPNLPNSPLKDVSTSTYETGLFGMGGVSFETRHHLDWRVQVRDLVDGYPAVYYGDQFCFVRATIGAEATVGEADDDWTSANNIAVSRHVVDAMVGPRDCGYNR